MICKGDVWVVRDDAYASKARPAIALQDEINTITETLAVTLITSFDGADPRVRYFIPATKENGLEHDSYVMIDKFAAIPKANFAQKCGRITDSQMLSIDKLLIDMLQIDISMMQ
jgi:mRNA interferase MazF